MITAEQVEQAAELLAERDEIARPLADMRASKRVRIAYQFRPSYAGKDEPTLQFRDGPEMEVTPAIRKLLMTDAMQRIAAIDEQLRALGVEPPPASDGDSP